MNRFINTLALAVIASVLLGASIACNTMAGAGKDTQDAGKAIENTADNNK